jgi:hypothetical protein
MGLSILSAVANWHVRFVVIQNSNRFGEGDAGPDKRPRGMLLNKFPGAPWRFSASTLRIWSRTGF